MGEKAIVLLRICAYLSLVLGVFLTVASSWLILVPSVTGFALLLVVCSIAENLIRIAENTKVPEKSRLFDR
jgi:hypothetical protein